MKLCLQVALSNLGRPYRYGGRTPEEGLDCSELVQLILHAGGADLPGDQNAQQLFDFFSKPAHHISQDAQLGALVFYGQGPKIHHVAWAVDRRRHIEAAGGGADTLSLESANRRGAFVKLTPIRFLSLDFKGCYMPDYPLVSQD